ncbi:MAG: hypothetical protein HY580_00985 [Nitrospinae bacterium]|nr:hypothetical protein [Nitrospinota bacterium]
METLLTAVENFVSQLPPLLQMLLGVFVTLAILKALMAAADFFEKKDSKKNN